MLYIAPHIQIDDCEIELTAVRAQGAGGQNINKVSSAIHLRFDIQASTLPPELKQHLLQTNDQRITRDGVIVIKAQTFRTQEMNRGEALRRLKELIQRAAAPRVERIATRPTQASRKRRLETKTRRGALKTLRGKIVE